LTGTNDGVSCQDLVNHSLPAINIRGIFVHASTTIVMTNLVPFSAANQSIPIVTVQPIYAVLMLPFEYCRYV
jgi:hypothetical protein